MYVYMHALSCRGMPIGDGWLVADLAIHIRIIYTSILKISIKISKDLGMSEKA